MGTSYVYDFPEMFHQTLKLEWEAHFEKYKQPDDETRNIPEELVVATELVLNKDETGLQEINRVAGLNNVRRLN